MSTVAIIPARMGSTRFPGKPLANRTGRPMIQHVVEQAARCTSLDRIIVATDDLRIAEAVCAFGGEVVMTNPMHPNGTSRIAEVAEGLDCDIILNIQGDEPSIEPSLIDATVAALLADPGAVVSTAATRFRDDEDPNDPRLVKVVLDARSRALYFSRAAVPFDRDGRSDSVRPLRHVGIYAYRRTFLAEYVRLPEGALERTEMLEQLRILEHGYAIAVVIGESATQGIDTPEQYEAWADGWLRARGPTSTDD
ncbi:MAG: 3-deoxy-manno-octulosonate cytidylyltransferase [Planctomycetota bacterium]|nr:3-deoxy-manno-octulosonate cytidylyltransferase [Planctomycetota bacterium]